MTPVDRDQIRREAIKDFVEEISPAIGISGFSVTEKKMQLSYKQDPIVYQEYSLP